MKNGSAWTLLSNHGHVLVCIASDPHMRLRDVAEKVGITERAVQKIVKDLQQAGYIEVRKQGRCNRYRINRRKSPYPDPWVMTAMMAAVTTRLKFSTSIYILPLRHPLEQHHTVGELVEAVSGCKLK